MFFVKSLLATAVIALVASAENSTDYGLVSVRSGSPVHLLTVTAIDNKLYLGSGDTIAGDVANLSDTGSQTGFVIESLKTQSYTPWLTVNSDGTLGYEYSTNTVAYPPEFEGWSWTDSDPPRLAYNGVEGATACYNSTGVAQLFFDTGNNNVSCPTGATAYGIDLRRSSS
ncbi:hypothetical protein RUND412_005785 [Rhizina undulata]